MAEKGPINFSRFMRHGTRGSRVDNGRQWSKRRPGRKKEARNKNGRKRAEKIFALYAPFPYYYNKPFDQSEENFARLEDL